MKSYISKWMAKEYQGANEKITALTKERKTIYKHHTTKHNSLDWVNETNHRELRKQQHTQKKSKLHVQNGYTSW